MVLESEVCTQHNLLSLVMCHAVMHVNILVSDLSIRVSEGRLLWCAARPDYVSESMVQALVPPGFFVSKYGCGCAPLYRHQCPWSYAVFLHPYRVYIDKAPDCPDYPEATALIM